MSKLRIIAQRLGIELETELPSDHSYLYTKRQLSHFVRVPGSEAPLNPVPAESAPAYPALGAAFQDLYITGAAVSGGADLELDAASRELITAEAAVPGPAGHELAAHAMSSPSELYQK